LPVPSRDPIDDTTTPQGVFPLQALGAVATILIVALQKTPRNAARGTVSQSTGASPSFLAMTER
jgi:hypothetical protein